MFSFFIQFIYIWYGYYRNTPKICQSKHITRKEIEMRLSSKTRYGLACTLYLANSSDKVSVQQLSSDLQLSPLYLQQVMSALKNGNIVNSIKGSGGGYELTRKSQDITLYDCLLALEPTLFEDTETATPNVDYHNVLDMMVFTPLNEKLIEFSQSLNLEQLSHKLKEHQSDALMFYI